jgi:hypothetical protein
VGECSSMVGWGTALQTGRSQVLFRMRSLDFSKLPNPSSLTVALGSTQPLTGMNTGNISGGKGWPANAWDWQAHHHLWADCLENVGASTSQPYGPPLPLAGIALPLPMHFYQLLIREVLTINCHNVIDVVWSIIFNHNVTRLWTSHGCSCLCEVLLPTYCRLCARYW